MTRPSNQQRISRRYNSIQFAESENCAVGVRITCNKQRHSSLTQLLIVCAWGGWSDGWVPWCLKDVMVSSRLGPLLKRFYLRGAIYDRELVPPPASPVVRLMGAGWDYSYSWGFEVPPANMSRGLVCLSSLTRPGRAVSSDDTLNLWRRFCVADL